MYPQIQLHLLRGAAAALERFVLMPPLMTEPLIQILTRIGLSTDMRAHLQDCGLVASVEVEDSATMRSDLKSRLLHCIVSA